MPRLGISLAAALLAATAAAESPSEAHFSSRPTVVGDTIEQTIVTSAELRSRTRSGAEVIEDKQAHTERRERRRVTATQIEQGRAVAAEVRFFEATSVEDGRQADEPVVGRAYHCRRIGDRLEVTADDGRPVTLAERVCVERAMESLGRSNPLGEYLAGRTVRVGQTLELPPEIAQQALGMDPRMARAERLALTLAGVTTQGEATLARFSAELEATGAGSSQMRLIVAGDVRVDAATCRVASADLAGPFGMLSTRGSHSRRTLIDSSGKLRIATSSEFRDATR